MKSMVKNAMLLIAAIALGSLPALAAAGAFTHLRIQAPETMSWYSIARRVDSFLQPGRTRPVGPERGVGLGNQGALAIDAANRYLFAVNAGSNNITVFQIEEHGLRRVACGACRRIATNQSYCKSSCFVCAQQWRSRGGHGQHCRFHRGGGWPIHMIVSGLPLSAASVGPAQIAFQYGRAMSCWSRKKTPIISTSFPLTTPEWRAARP